MICHVTPKDWETIWYKEVEAHFPLQALNLERKIAESECEVGVSMLEVGTGELSLSVRGFEQSDPHAVERFRAFCQSNFGLSQEVTNSLGSASDTVVLSIGASEDELRALAKVMTEIGALVEISHAAHPEGSGRATHKQAFSKRSNVRVNKLFRPSTDRETRSESTIDTDLAETVVSFTPTLRLHYDITLQNRRGRRAMAHAIEPRGTSHTPAPYRLRRWITIGTCALLSGIGALSLSMRPSLTSEPLTSLPALSMVETDTGIELREPALPISRTLHGSFSSGGYALALNVLLSKTTVSVSGLAISIEREGLPPLKAQAEPLFLTERAPGIWFGELLLSVVGNEMTIGNNTAQHIPITVRVASERSATAEVSLPSYAPRGELSAYGRSQLIEVPLAERWIRKT